MRQVDDYIKDMIVEWLKKNALGRENAKPRKLLENYVRFSLFVDISDRTLRRIYAKTNRVGYACRDPKGIFWIDDIGELQAFKAEQESKAISIFTRTKKTQIAVEAEGQGSLFG